MPQKMYSVAMRHLSGIQKGIQSGHSVVEFQLKHGESKQYKRWARKDKTMIVLEANTSSQLDKLMRKLRQFRIPYAPFREPDLDNIVTSVSFLIDECSPEFKEHLNVFRLASN